MSKAKNKENNQQENAHTFDPIALSQTLIDVYNRAQPIFEQAFERYSADLTQQNFDPMNVGPAYIEFMKRFMENPEQFWALQSDYWNKWMALWEGSTRKMMGEDVAPTIQPDKGDRRFKAEDWQENAVFDFIKQSYLLTCDWMDKSVRNTEGLEEKDKEKIVFYNTLFANALSPSNFVMTNPEVLKETLSSGGENLIKGLENLMEDLERGHGTLKISTTDYKAFELGKNIATTPGRVIYQNDLIQLIQYEPSTEKVFKTPLLIVPPWINKYYILDLREHNSLVKWAVDQGHTVFAVSWVNPDTKLAKKSFEDYMDEGLLAALGQIEAATKEAQTNVIGYCLGGTLLSTTLAYLEAKGEAQRVKSATFLTTLLDFEDAGEMKLFLDDAQLEIMDKDMADKGVFEARHLQKTFSLLRSNDLIWSFVVNNYLMGKEPFPFDLLYWNDDSTNMPASMHSFYLRNMYRDNKLTQPGGITMRGVPIDLRTVKTPAYFLSTREDHIAPWKATYQGTQMLSGPVTFTLAASGHIAGVVNPPEKQKYCYWADDQPAHPTPAKAQTPKSSYPSPHGGEPLPKNPEDWLKSAKEHTGSWWPHWQKWVQTLAGEKVSARKPAKGIEAAPGSYVRVVGN